MNWTELLVAVVSHVSWPITIITLAWMFRAPLRSAMGRIESANSKYLKLTLRSHEPFDKLNRAEGIADTLELPLAPDLKSRPRTDFEKALKPVTALAAKQPVAGLSSSWDLLIRMTEAAVKKKNGVQPPADQIIPEAAKCFDPKIVGLMALLLMIVEQQKSNPSAAIDKEFVFRFIKLTGRVILSIDGVSEVGNTKTVESTDVNNSDDRNIAGDIE